MHEQTAMQNRKSFPSISSTQLSSAFFEVLGNSHYHYSYSCSRKLLGQRYRNEKVSNCTPSKDHMYDLNVRCSENRRYNDEILMAHQLIPEYWCYQFPNGLTILNVHPSIPLTQIVTVYNLPKSTVLASLVT